MRNGPGMFLLRVMLLVAMVAATATALPAQSDPARRAPAEVAVGGPVIAERLAAQRAMHDEISAIVPAGVENAPLWIDITQKDREALAAPVAPGTAPQRIGVVKAVPEFVGIRAGGSFQRGVIEEKADGSIVWAVQVASTGAQALRLHMTGFSLPPGAEMFLIGSNGQADGPYTGQGRDGNGDFWTRSIAADEATVVVRYPAGTGGVLRAQTSLTIAEVGHVSGRPPRPVEQSHDSWPCSDNAPCVVDVNCVNTGPAAAAENAVAKMEWIQGPFIYTCTGGLLADTDGSSQIPYFLTANHCLSQSNANLETFFDYTTDSCNGTCPHNALTGGAVPPADTVGVTLVATGSAGDFTLLRLNQAPPAGSTFLGWNNAPIANSNGAHLYRISNPNFGPQAYSQHDVDASSPTCTGWPRGQRIYSVDRAGATMGGSSGSPVVNGAGEVVGQLSGCCGFNCADECDSANNWTVDGALAYYWSQVAPFLDPQGGGACDFDGTCEAGEDCITCPDDCRSKTGGNPSTRYCCDGDLQGCGNSQCSADGWSCGGGGGCTTNAQCSDGQFCNGAEICSAGTCQAGSNPCPGQGCNESTDQCVTCGGNRSACSVNSDCCSNNCKNGTCKGN